MKKHKILWVLCLTAILLLSACGGESGIVKLGEYKGHTVAKVPYEVLDSDIENYLNEMLYYSAPTAQITDRAVAEGDRVIIDYRGLLDGEAFEGGTAEGAGLTIGSGQFIPGFEEGLVGIMPGAQIELPITFPADYHSEDLAGKDVVFEVTVHHIQGAAIIPELNDEWVAEYTTFETLESYRAALREDMEAEQRYEAEQSELSALFDVIFEGTTFGKLPKNKVEERALSIKQYNESIASMMGTDLKGYLAYYGVQEAAFYDWLNETAEEAVKGDLIFEAIAKAENITLSDADREEYATQNGYESYAAIIENNDAETVDHVILDEKINAFLRENNTFA